MKAQYKLLHSLQFTLDRTQLRATSAVFDNSDGAVFQAVVSLTVYEETNSTMPQLYLLMGDDTSSMFQSQNFLCLFLSTRDHLFSSSCLLPRSKFMLGVSCDTGIIRAVKANLMVVEVDSTAG